MAKKQLIIVGNGMAGGRLLDELLQRQALDQYEITVFGEERTGCYNRIMLSKVLGGACESTITLKTTQWYEEQGIRLIAGKKVTEFQTEAHQIVTESGEIYPYDQLVIATGSYAFIPPIPGTYLEDRSLKPGVFAFRTLEDCARMRAASEEGRHAVVIGGGLLGLEAAKGLADLGLDTTLLHIADGLMERQLDTPAGTQLARTIEALGIKVIMPAMTQQVLGDDRVTGIQLKDGPEIPCDLLVVACGVRPRVEVAKASGLPVNRAILVDDQLAVQETPDVFAVGECCEHRGVCYGIVSPIWEQVRVLAEVLTGTDPEAIFEGIKVYTRLKVAGVEVASMGLVHPEVDEDEVVQIAEARRGIYRKMIIREDRLVGAQFVGNADAAASILQYLERGDLLPTNRIDLLCSDEARGMGTNADREICNCNRVNESTIKQSIASGCDSIAAIGNRTAAGTGCGSCQGELARLLQAAGKARRPEPAPAV
ncbi:3-oxoacyl-[acyl-carrier protein] reductase [Planctomycetales bacterium 10988]|nr:3-oxoacyl-[acyl-carrier protein] reductase [Planctomycetales bacterium 10988]